MKYPHPPVLYFHSVAPDYFDSWSLKWLTLPLRFFEDQIQFLRSQDYQSVFLEEWLAIRTGDQAQGGKKVCLTFDDGLLDNWVYAFPVAKKYGMRFTLFVSPECVNPQPIVRPTLEDVWQGNCRYEDLQGLGYCSWEELRLMQESGVVDIQSHTMSHTKYIASSEVVAFYYGGALGVYPILNRDPGLKPFYPADPDFERRLSWGTPLFEEASAVVVRRKKINPEALAAVEELAARFYLEEVEARPAYEEEARRILIKYREQDRLVVEHENEETYLHRLHYEIVDSKAIIEERLGKPVRFMCWPHGDNTQQCHDLARKAGYLATTSGKMEAEADKEDRIPRFGVTTFRDHRWLSRKKFQYKLGAHFGDQPYSTIAFLNNLKYKIVG